MSALDPFYPIVDSAAWVARLVGAGARLIQLRVKDSDEAAVEPQAREALAICQGAGAVLVVNDYWRLAIRIGAIPLVAIGGLNVERGRACLDAGADIVSVVTDITLNADPEARTREWIAATRR